METEEIISILISIVGIIITSIPFLTILKNRITPKKFYACVKISGSEYKQGTNFYHTRFEFSFENKTNKNFYLYSIVPIILNKEQNFYIAVNRLFEPILVNSHQKFQLNGFIKSNYGANVPKDFDIKLEVHNKNFYMHIKDYEPNKLLIPITKDKHSKK